MPTPARFGDVSPNTPPAASITSLIEAKRRSETLRKRKYRAAKQAELKLVEAELRYWQNELDRLQDDSKRANKPDRANVIVDTIVRANQSLHAQVNDTRRLAQLLFTWVKRSTTPGKSPDFKASCMHSTLLADPDARRRGYHWLTQRVYHNACAAYPHHPLGRHVEDSMYIKPWIGVDMDDGDQPSFVAFETHSQTTVFASMADAARVAWMTNVKPTSAAVTYEDAESVQLEDGRDVLYYRHVNHYSRSSMRVLTSRFDEPSRIIITYVMIAEDEAFPPPKDTLQAHGYGWTSFDRIADSVTLVRSSGLQWTPTTPSGTLLPLASIGRLFGISSHGIEHRTAYLERMATFIDADYARYQRMLNQRYVDMLGEPNE